MSTHTRRGRPLSFAMRKWRTCSVVSTSGVLLHHRDGAAIDRADAVVRLGWGPVAGFEEHIGRRTTLRFSSITFLEHDRGLSREKIDPILAAIPAGGEVVLMSTSKLMWQYCSRCATRQITAAAPAPLNSPELLSARDMRAPAKWPTSVPPCPYPCHPMSSMSCHGMSMSMSMSHVHVLSLIHI